MSQSSLPLKPKLNASTTTTLGRIRGRSIKILLLLMEEPSRTIKLGERLDYPAAYVWKYLKNLQKYGLVREQDSFWFLTDKGASFTLTLSTTATTSTTNTNTINRTRKKLERRSKETRNIENQGSKQVSLEGWQPKYPLDEMSRRVVEVMVAQYNNTMAQGKAQIGFTFPAHYDKYNVAEYFVLTLEQLDEVNRTLINDGIGFTCRRYEGRWKAALFKEFVERRIQEQKSAKG